MMINITPAGGGLFIEPAARRHINFAADDGLDAFLAGGLVKINHPMHRAVIGDRERGEFQFVGLVHQAIEAAGAIEQ
jgi:hypothetical protein